MRPVNTMKAIVLSVLIVTGSAATSEADDSRFNVPMFVSSLLPHLPWTR